MTEAVTSITYPSATTLGTATQQLAQTSVFLGGGSSGGSGNITAVAAVDLTYPSVVTLKNNLVAPADPTSVADMTAKLAITTASASAGSPINISDSLIHTETAWNWAIGRVYLAPTGGGLTQSPDPSGAILEVGRAISPTTIAFGIEPATLR